MIIQKISNQEYEDFVSKSPLKSFYQSIEWMQEKEAEGRRCEIVGLFDNDTLVGASLVMYLKVMKRYYIAYASRGFIYDYKDITKNKKALVDYFDKKTTVMVKIDPPVILATYDKELNRTVNEESSKLIEELKNNGFIHFGYNMAAEAYQFRFVHRLTLHDTYDEELKEMNKSTRKNIELATFRGAKIRHASVDELDEVLKCFQYTIDRKEIKGFSREFYENLLKYYGDKCKMYLVYIDKQEYLSNLKSKINELEQEQLALNKEMERVNVGNKLNVRREQLMKSLTKYQTELKEVKDFPDGVNIASMLTITKYDEVVSLTSGMDNDYRVFCPKYLMYPEMIKEAINEHLKYVNFLGVKNITDPNDKDHGVYEVKRGFGGETLEYIGEFDLPINIRLYKIYMFINKIKGKK